MAMVCVRVAGPVRGDGWVLEVDDPADPSELTVRRERASGTRPRRVAYVGPHSGQVSVLVAAGVPWPHANELVHQLAAAGLRQPRRRRPRR